jgi:hypothetical protein
MTTAVAAHSCTLLVSLDAKPGFAFNRAADGDEKHLIAQFVAHVADAFIGGPAMAPGIAAVLDKLYRSASITE